MRLAPTCARWTFLIALCTLPLVSLAQTKPPPDTLEQRLKGRQRPAGHVLRRMVPEVAATDLLFGDQPGEPPRPRTRDEDVRLRQRPSADGAQKRDRIRQVLDEMKHGTRIEAFPGADNPWELVEPAAKRVQSAGLRLDDRRLAEVEADRAVAARGRHREEVAGAAAQLENVERCGSEVDRIFERSSPSFNS